MEEDLFGTSVWDAPGPSTTTPATNSIIPSGSSSQDGTFYSFPPPSTASQARSTGEDDFDDFDDFGPPTEPTAVPSTGGLGEDDDFGDFGDFGEVQEPLEPLDSSTGGGGGFIAMPNTTLTAAGWEPLKLEDASSLSRVELESQIEGILWPIWANDDLASVTTDEQIREVEGPAQTLVTPESRELYDLLFSEPPQGPPPSWIRSKIRREHLISLGIPINLDETASSKPLPPLQITTRPMSAPPGPRGGAGIRSTNNSNAPSPVGSRSGTPQPGVRGRQPTSVVSSLGLGPPPELDEGKIEELLGLTHESMSLLTLATLESRLKEIKSHTVQTSTKLTYLLQTRDALQQDSETYNSLIGELIGEAQRMKTGAGAKGKEKKRGSGFV